jgi:hypothetical protein
VRSDVDLTPVGQDPIAGFYDDCDEPSDSMKGRKFLIQLSDYQLLSYNYVKCRVYNFICFYICEMLSLGLREEHM